MEIQPATRDIGTTVVCPKCGFTQSGDGIECLRCGIVFSKYKPSRGVHDDQLDVPHKSKLERAETHAMQSHQPHATTSMKPS